MKLRIRHGKKTKPIFVEDQPTPTISLLKNAIRENVFEEWGLLQENEFQISLDGKTGVTNDGTTLKHAGIVSGDLIKLLFMDNGTIPTHSSDHSVPAQSASYEQVDTSPAVSQMSVTPGREEEPGPSSSDNFEDIPCISPGPIFFRDCALRSEVPHLVQKMYEDDSIKNEFQALCIVLHFMMRESGFFVEGINEQTVLLSLFQRRIFVVEYSHSAGPGLLLNFSCNQLANYILVNAVVQPCSVSAEQVLTLQVVIHDHIQSFNVSNKNNNAAAVFKNLSKLNRQVKETIAHPALNNMREELQLPPVHGLLSLFPEILQFVFSFLDCNSLVALSQANKALREMTNDDNLWRNLYIKDFKSHPAVVGASWKTTYAKRYKREKEYKDELKRRYRDNGPNFRPQFPTPGPGSPVPLPEQPFGMIGGEHDLYPSFPYGPFANPLRRLPPTHPVHPTHPDNPLPGSRFDPIYPGGGFRPGRGGGVMDPDFESFGSPMMPFPNRQGRARHNQRFGFL